MDLREFKRKILKDLILGSPSLFFFALSKPEADNIIPFRHQIQTLYHAMIARPVRMLIADEIGLGKTVQALAVARFLELRKEAKRILVLVPKILCRQWEREIQRVGGRVYTISKGTEVENVLKKDGYIVVSVDLAKMAQHRAKFLEGRWDLIIADEVHNITINSQRYEFLRDLVKANPDVNIVFLSATPHRGDVKDYLARISLLDTTLRQDSNSLDKLDKPSFYRETKGIIVLRRTKEIVNALEERPVFKECSFNAVVVSLTEEEKAFLEELDRVLRELIMDAAENSPQALIAAIIRKRAASCYEAAVKTITRIISCVKKENKDVSEKIDQAIQNLFGVGYDDLELEESEEIDEAVDGVISKVSPLLSKAQIAQLESLLKKAANLKADSKLEAISRIISYHLKNGEKVILFTEFKDTLEYLKRKLPALLENAEFVFLYGGLLPEEVNERIKHFREKANVLVSTDIASEGLNLQEASVLINYEAPWTPIKLEQRVGRIWRLKQTRKTTAYTVFLAAEAEQYVLESLYKRIMNISEALGVAPDLGVPHIFSGDFSRIWKVEASAAGMEFYIPTEYQLILSSIRRKLDVHAKNIVNTISSIRNSADRLIPVSEAKEIRKELIAALSEQDLDFGAVESVLKEYVEEVLGEKTWNVSNRLYSIVTDEGLEEPKKRIGLIVKGSGKRFYIYKLDLAKNDYSSFSTLVIYPEGESQILLSSEALRCLVEVLSSDILVQFLPEEDSFNRITRKDFVEDQFEKSFCLYLKRVREYDDWLKRRRFKTKKLFKEFKFKAQEIALVEKVSERRFNLLKFVSATLLNVLNLKEDEVELPTKEYLHAFERNFIPLDEIVEVERKAMKIVMDLERKRGANLVEDVSLRKHFDILVKSDAGEKFIEVKGHKPLLLRAEVTEAEYKFAVKPENIDKYWIYIVANIGAGKPVIVKIYRPFDDKYSRIWVVAGDEDIEITEYTQLDIKSNVRRLIIL